MKYDPWLEKYLFTAIRGNYRRLLLAVAIIGPVVFFGFRYSLTSSWAYQSALVRTTSSKSIKSQIGEPIKADFWVGGRIEWTGSKGTAFISITVCGPRGEGIVTGYAEKSESVWRFERLVFEGENGSEIYLVNSGKDTSN